MPKITAAKPSEALPMWVISLSDSAYALGSAAQHAGSFVFRPQRLGVRRFPQLVELAAPDLDGLLGRIEAQIATGPFNPPLDRP